MTESGFIGFAPFFPWPVIAALAAVAAVLVGLAAVRGRGAAGWRALALGVLILAMANPRAVRQDRRPLSDIVLVVVDKSASQNAPGRREQTRAALRRVLKAAAAFDGLEVKVVEYGGEKNGNGGKGNGGGGTRLYSALMDALAKVAEKRLAAAVLITDGQVNDAPPGIIAPLPGGPVHVLLTGSDRDWDRGLSVVKAPGFGIVGKKVSLTYRVEDGGNGAGQGSGGKIPVTLRINGRAVEIRPSRVGVEEEISFTIDRAGPLAAELTVPAVKGELSLLNNRVGLSINGVRDRLKVLLISGQPYMGERTWRNLLKSDPSVDLVHFTILRPPEKNDFTPINELALIAFPVRELFEEKLKEFDLVIFDRYMIRGVLPLPYMANIEAYVREGGALLFASGPEFAGIRSLYRTPLGPVMPVKPTGKVVEEAFYPRLTDKGRRHPVTATLAASPSAGGKPAWGRWFRQVEARKTSGVTVMEGIGGRPLLVLDRVEKGRVAHLTSDQIWLWAKGFEGGGPYAELLRRLVHWLMKEPDLEEEALKARIEDGRLIIDRQSLDEGEPTVRVTDPAGVVTEVALEAASSGGPGRARGRAAVTGPGLYRVESGAMTALAAAGAGAAALEFADLLATARPLTPLVRASGGGVAWIKDGLPDFRRTRPGRDQAGRGWMGLRRNGAYLIAGVSEIPLLPWYAYLIGVFAGLILAWRREVL